MLHMPPQRLCFLHCQYNICTYKTRDIFLSQLLNEEVIDLVKDIDIGKDSCIDGQSTFILKERVSTLADTLSCSMSLLKKAHSQANGLRFY